MLRCAVSFVIAAYPKVRFISQDLRALPANFLRSRPKNVDTVFPAVALPAVGPIYYQNVSALVFGLIQGIICGLYQILAGLVHQ